MSPLLRITLALAVLTPSCDSSKPTSAAGSQSAPSSVTPASNHEPQKTAVADPIVLPAANEKATAAFVQGSNSLGAKLFGEMRKSEEGNFSLSPLSISLALIMGAAGARGETEKEMAALLGWHGDREHLASAGQLLEGWSAPQKGPRLDLTQRMFGQENADFHSDYLLLLDQVFHAPLERLNFLGSPEVSRKHINSWVSGNTNERIKELLPVGSIDASTRLVLVNTLFFLADWQQAFDKLKTQDAPFHLTKMKPPRFP